MPSMTELKRNTAMDMPDGEELRNSIELVSIGAMQYSVSFETCQGQALTGGCPEPSGSESWNSIDTFACARVNINCARVSSTA